MEAWEYRAIPEQCAIIHHLLTGHDCGGSNGYADCKCGKEWHWPITEEQQAEYEREVAELESGPGATEYQHGPPKEAEPARKALAKEERQP